MRVAHVGTGATGREALRGIIAHPDLELATMWVASADKVGRDAGELVSVDPVGITAVGSLSEALDCGPDVLSYCGNGLGRETEVVSEVARALERGVDVITISLLGMLYPPAGPAELRVPLKRRLQQAIRPFCRQAWTPGSPAICCPWRC